MIGANCVSWQNSTAAWHSKAKSRPSHTSRARRHAGYSCSAGRGWEIELQVSKSLGQHPPPHTQALSSSPGAPRLTPPSTHPPASPATHHLQAVVHRLGNEAAAQRIFCVRAVLDGWVREAVADGQALQVDGRHHLATLAGMEDAGGDRGHIVPRVGLACMGGGRGGEGSQQRCVCVRGMCVGSAGNAHPPVTKNSRPCSASPCRDRKNSPRKSSTSSATHASE